VETSRDTKEKVDRPSEGRYTKESKESTGTDKRGILMEEQENEVGFVIQQPRLGCEADHSPPSSAEVTKVWSYSTPTIHLHGMVLS
jgi:hypothetical protein